MPTPHYGQPRYRVIADKLRERIESGSIPPGTLLPTESALTTEFRVSRGTIRQAIALLREEHLVDTEHGRGTYASRPAYDSGTEKSAVETQRREVAADPELAALFDVAVGTTLIEHQSIGRRDGAVGTVVRTYRLIRAEF